MKNLIVTLKNPANQTYDLIYEVRNTVSAHVWADTVLKAQSSGLSEVDRFDGFPENPRSEPAFLIDKVNGITSQLRPFYPELDFPLIEKAGGHETLFQLHQNFVHSVRINKSVKAETEDLWRDLNVTIHALEAVLNRLEWEKKVDMNICQIYITWREAHHIPLPESALDDFTLNREFGVAYMNYPQIGRHLHEMFTAQDDILPDEHIQPFRFISADTLLWLGPTTGHFVESLDLSKMKYWFEERKERFNRLGLYWGDPKLTLGYLPVARLKENFYTKKEINSFVQHVSHFNQLDKVRIES